MSKHTRFIAFILGTILTSTAHAWVATGGHNGYHGAYTHGDHYGTYYHHGGYYYNEGWSAHGVVIGAPAGVYNGYGCGIVLVPTANGYVNERVCE